MTKSYITDEINDDWGFKKLQNKILEIMVDIDEVCTKNSIEYFIYGGTALGAKRHNGFIPWDDDLDIIMTAQNYEKFIKVFFEQTNKDKYHLQEYNKVNNMILMSKILANNTTSIAPIFKNMQIHQGIFVDIFIVHVCPDNIIKQRIQWLWSRYIVVLSLIRRGYKKKGIYNLISKILSIFPKDFLKDYAIKQMYKYDYEVTKYYCDFSGRSGFKQTVYPKKMFEDSVRVPFENVELSASKYQDEYLKMIFGDFMKMPSIENIKRLQHTEIWDTEKNYTEYLPGINSFNDEKYL